MDYLCLETIGLIVAPWKFDVLKTGIFALKASPLWQIFVFRASNFRGAADSFSTETLLFKSKSLARDLIFNYYSALGGFVGSTPEKAFSSIEMRVLHV